MTGALPHTMLAPMSTPGDNHDKSVQIRKIHNIPDDISDHEAMRLFESVTDLTGFCGKTQRLEFDYAELGVGKIIR